VILSPLVFPDSIVGNLTDQGDDTDNADSDDKLAPKLLWQRRDVLSRRELKGEGDEGETVAD